MDPLRVIAHEQGFFTRRQAASAGYDDRAVARMVRSGVWTRFRRGYFCFSDVWGTLDAVGRHWVRARAVVDSLGDAVVLSHVSGAVAHGIEVWGVPLDRVHVTRLDGGAGRVEGDVVHHEGICLEADVVEAGAGVRATSSVRSVLETASRASTEAAFCLLEMGLHHGRFTQGELCRMHHRLGVWPGMQHLHVPVRMATGRSESIGEARGYWLFRTAHVPAPVQQLEVRDERGVLLGTCDWGWPDLLTLGEFDGRLKYGRILKPGQDPGEVVFAEKQREDALREATGFRMLRLVWSDLDHPATTVRRLERLMRRPS
ncbi:type IV toxin-antitoxin system AbiEi family antitoxin domain-containing protein [Nocardioides sp.]|uniref:type IV toxin-antitoxin system AbiEi family antitoxin domain-containing protein n=1 Tax=Nocardioides sp. TaxID=35761 RepID=UPI00378306A2